MHKITNAKTQEKRTRDIPLSLCALAYCTFLPVGRGVDVTGVGVITMVTGVGAIVVPSGLGVVKVGGVVISRVGIGKAGIVVILTVGVAGIVSAITVITGS